MPLETMRKKRIAVIGSTGSIGKQTLDVVSDQPDSLEIVALAAGINSRDLADQVRRFKPQGAVLADEKAAADLRISLGDCAVPVSSGRQGLIDWVTSPNVDTVVMAVSGCIGLEPTLAALQAGKQVALANKETLVAAGELVMGCARERPGSLIPIDSEHSAVWQCLNCSGNSEPADFYNTKNVGRLILTASGGPFRTWDAKKLATATAADALKHPNWQMGAKITIDSATLMNKGLEVIEAHHLFDMPYEAINVLIHPQSIVHSMVVYDDGAMLAQLGVPDMRLPIQYALSYPERWPVSQTPDLTQQALTFEEVDNTRFPAMKLAYDCGAKGGLMPAVMNAANEIAVHAFLTGKISYPLIYEIVAGLCAAFDNKAALTLESVLEADAWAREEAGKLCRRA